MSFVKYNVHPQEATIKLNESRRPSFKAFGLLMEILNVSLPFQKSVNPNAEFKDLEVKRVKTLEKEGLIFGSPCQRRRHYVPSPFTHKPQLNLLCISIFRPQSRISFHMAEVQTQSKIKITIG